MNEALQCPPLYNIILDGCYKFNINSSVTRSEARQQCADDSTVNSIAHLVALETEPETLALIYWMKGKLILIV
jgi:hypothetical protein